MRALDRRLALAFADLLEYPHLPPADALEECTELVGGIPEAASLVGRFRAFAEGATLGELQEAYTGAFDLDSLSDLEPTCYPYVGHHLFDDNHKRSAFLVALNGHYRRHGFVAEGELPDHLVCVLRFLADCPDEELAEELLDEALLPALERMARAAAAGGSEGGGANGRAAYKGLLAALHAALAERSPASFAEAR